MRGQEAAFRGNENVPAILSSLACGVGFPGGLRRPDGGTLPTAGNIKTIGVLTPRFPDGPYVILASSVGQSFGLIGGLVDASMRSNREAAFSSLLATQRFSVADAFQQSLVAALQAQGYAVEFIPVVRDGASFLTDYRVAGNGKVDAYLDLVALGYGYVAAGIQDAAPYRPVFASTPSWCAPPTVPC